MPFLTTFKRSHAKNASRIENGNVILVSSSRSFVTVAAISTLVALAPWQAFAATSCGGASWYAEHSRTASGEHMNPSKLTAAHKTLPFGTQVKVTNRKNGKTVVVRINDRGPFIKGRVLDLSKAAAANLGMVASGTGKVCYELIG
ncbi:rare lipoprotein A [Agrobacterium vitis]|uniref:Endolytic peptidoglycan transglycosylase RlpA n=1 Tax=Allorhizobium terrae TaxID=1848972 RepID=A0A4S3ZTQ7_9HYPH|nr:septal ring lytic transglycosylase RlpA family protein [Allorhizobium terrae]TWD55680.1 rare lipoprotein A [Agrobacterium vitis]